MGCWVSHLGPEGGVDESKSLDTVFLPPPAEFFDTEGSEVDLNFGGLRGRGVRKQDPPIERDLYLSLEDLFFGCTKKIKISRRVSTWFAPTKSHHLSLPTPPVTSFLTLPGDLWYDL